MAAPVDAKLLKKTKFPPEFNRKVDMKKVNIEVMKKYAFPGFPKSRDLGANSRCRWIASRISEVSAPEYLRAQWFTGQWLAIWAIWTIRKNWN